MMRLFCQMARSDESDNSNMERSQREHVAKHEYSGSEREQFALMTTQTITTSNNKQARNMLLTTGRHCVNRAREPDAALFHVEQIVTRVVTCVL